MMKGSTFKQVGTITLSCMSAEALDLLDTIMEDWEKHNIERLKLFPGKRASIYSFAYWLVRWSGLVRPNNIDHRDKK